MAHEAVSKAVRHIVAPLVNGRVDQSEHAGRLLVLSAATLVASVVRGCKDPCTAAEHVLSEVLELEALQDVVGVTTPVVESLVQLLSDRLQAAVDALVGLGSSEEV